MGNRRPVAAMATLIISGGLAALLAAPVPAESDHIGANLTPCDAADTAGGGALGLSPGPIGPPSSLGWDVGSGQCNGSFTTRTDTSFPSETGGGIELAMRAEERRIGQVTRIAPNDYEVQLGHDTTAPPAINRAWWNIQHSIAYDGDINTLDSLVWKIRTDVGPNLPSSPAFDLLAARSAIDDRNNQPNATATYSDLYQTSQNPEFGWFVVDPDTDANPTGAFDYDVEGAWLMSLTATKDGQVASVSICIHTPGAACLPAGPAHNVLEDCWTSNRGTFGLPPAFDDPLEIENYYFTTDDPISFVWKHKITEACSSYTASVFGFECIDGKPQPHARFRFKNNYFGPEDPDPEHPERLLSLTVPGGTIPPGSWDWALVVECDDSQNGGGPVSSPDGDVDDVCGLNLGIDPVFPGPVVLGPDPVQLLDGDPGGIPRGRVPGENGTTRAWCFEVVQSPCGEHDECTTGVALTPSCSPCVALVCNADAFCCTSSWDLTCVDIATDLCAPICDT